MNIDQLLIQYLHDEISPEDKALFEKELANNPELQQELIEMRSIDLFLQEELTTEFEDGLPSEMSEKIITASETKKKSFRWFSALSKVAALLLVCFVATKAWFVPDELVQQSNEEIVAASDVKVEDAKDFKVEVFALQSDESMTENQKAQPMRLAKKNSLKSKMISRSRKMPSPKDDVAILEDGMDDGEFEEDDFGDETDIVDISVVDMPLKDDSDLEDLGDEEMDEDFDAKEVVAEKKVAKAKVANVDPKKTENELKIKTLLEQGKIHLRNNRIAEAIYSFDRVRRLDPLNKQAYHYLTEAQSKLKEFKKQYKKLSRSRCCNMVNEAWTNPLKESETVKMHYSGSIAKYGGRHSARKVNTEAYDHVSENEFVNVIDEALSTFSIDVDTASYSNIRRFVQRGQLPPKGSVRVEEMINYFNNNYQPPQDDKPFSVDLALSTCPWNSATKLVRIGLKGQEIDSSERPEANLVFLVDVSGSMSYANKLPLLKRSLKMLLNNLNKNDRVAIVVYASATGLVLPSTPCSEQEKIIDALDRLNAGGSTNGGAGIELAYKTAINNFKKDGINRVILCTDGDFNVGVSSQDALIEQIQKNAKTGVFLSVLGFGMGNYKDSTLEKLANKGNGVYGYIDDIKEARKLFVDQINGSLMTIAKDVKIQVEFNPNQVKSYRLVGYENRQLNKQDFNDDKKDAGEIGAGHTVTALYELKVKSSEPVIAKVDALKYQERKAKKSLENEIMTVKVRYKEPKEDVSKLLEFPLTGQLSTVDSVPESVKFPAAVATFGMLLKDSKFKADANFELIKELCKGVKSAAKKEFVELVEKVEKLQQMK